MAYELRFIAFSRREVLAMLRDQGALGDLNGVELSVREITKTADGDIAIALKDGAERESTVLLREADAIRFMLRRCAERHYPVAQKFTKHAEATGNALVLGLRGRAQALAPYV